MNTLSKISLFVVLLSSILSTTGQAIEVHNLTLTGTLTDSGVEFTSSGTIIIENKRGADISLLAGDIALLETPSSKSGKIEYKDGEYRLIGTRPGEYPFSLRFLAKVHETDEQSSVAFSFLSTPIRRLELKGFPEDVELLVANAASPIRKGDSWIAPLSPESHVNFSWRPASPEDEGQLFYTCDITNIAVVAPGMIKQNQQAQLQVLQGEISEVSFGLNGPGEISQVEGRDILGWKIEKTNATDRKLLVRFNRPQTGTIALLVRSQTALHKLPTTTDPLLLEPQDATRSSGNLLLLSDGAVNLGIASQQNLSQISPIQVPLSSKEKRSLNIAKRQAFGFRYAGIEQKLQVQIEDILPEISVSSISLHHIGLNEARLDVDLNLEIREASLQELSLKLPADYSVLKVEQAQLNDYIVVGTKGAYQNMKLTFSKPILGRQSLKLTLEKNGETADGTLSLPQVEISDAKSVRGYVGVTSDSGLKITRESDKGLTEIIPSFFPVRNEQLQVAYRLREANWDASIEIEHLDPTIQAESFHLFSLAESVVYGSTILTYQISGAPIQSLSLELSEAYENIEISGGNIRDWRKQDGAYKINFHSPISGTYSLLATYEAKHGSESQSLPFTGAIPLETHSERGYIVFVSPNQVELDLGQVQSPLLSLEAKELPPEYQIMIDAPIIESLHYASRHFTLESKPIALSQEKSIDQVVELAQIKTSITKTGEILFEAIYLFKSKNVANFSLQLPENARLWKIDVDGTEPVVSRSGEQILIPINNSAKTPTRRLSIRYTLQQEVGVPILLSSPILSAPALQTRWDLTPDDGYQLEFHHGSIEPVNHSATPVPLQGFNKATPLLSPLFLVALFAVPILLGLRRADLCKKLPWLPYLGALVAGIGFLIAIPLANSLHSNNPIVNSPSLHIQDTVLSAGEAITLSLSNIETAEAASSTSILPWLLLVAIVPYLIRGIVSKWAPSNAQLPLLLLVNSALAAAFTFHSSAAALVTLLLASFYFGPILQESISGIVSNYQLRLNKKRMQPAATAGLIALLFAVSPFEMDAQTKEFVPNDGAQYVRKEAVDMSAFVTDEYATVSLNFTWDAETGESTPILFFPAVITRMEIPSKYVSLGQGKEGTNSVYTLEASRSGKHEIEIEYQTPVTNRNGVWDFSIQSLPSLVYQGEIVFDREDCEVLCSSAVGISYAVADNKHQTKATLQLKPNWNIAITSKPRDRDTRLEETVYYAETVNSYHPQAGAIEGQHHSTLRIAQGELRSVSLAIPSASTVTDVSASWVASWRYDPSEHMLTITADRPLKETVSFDFSTQTNAQALPYNTELELVRFPDADSELGWLGLSVTSEEQLESIQASDALASVSVYDFPSLANSNLNESAKLRYAYRYATPTATIQFDLAKVDPEIRVTSEEITSLSEDRIVHNATLKTQILRSGVFQMQLLIPDAYDIEKITGPEVSHWTEGESELGRLVTLHFKSRTEGQTPQYLTLSSPGIRENAEWSPPHIKVVGASKQRGILTLSPELGLQCKVLERSGVSQLDPNSSSSIDRNKIGFRLLESDWNIDLAIEQVDPWIDCRLLQEVTFKSGIVETKATLRYDIKNAGIKQLRLRLPSSAIGVNFSGEHISGFQKSTQDASIWEVELDRRIINSYSLNIEYQEFGDTNDENQEVSGIATLDTQLQESFLSLRTEQRLSLQLNESPEQLSSIEWQQIPDDLRSASNSNTAATVYRTIQPNYQFPLAVTRLDMAQVLPAEIRKVQLDSILSESGMILTRALFSLDAGHKPNLNLELPADSQFWSCNIAGQSVWPVVKDGKLRVPLPASGDQGTLIDLELTYLTISPEENSEFSFIGPQCDLPLENIEWRLYLPSNYEEYEWSGNLDRIDNTTFYSSSFGLESLVKRNEQIENRKLKNAETLLKRGNALAQEGKQLDAKRALESAYNLSLNDVDFNEDARVQWNNLRIQQAMVGLTSRRSNAFNQSTSPNLNLNQESSDQINFSSTWADQVLQDNNSAEENRSLSKLALHFVEHQDSALKNPSGLSTLFPEHGVQHVFKRKLQAEPWQDMNLHLQVSNTESKATLPLIIVLTLAGFLSLLTPRKKK